MNTEERIIDAVEASLNTIVAHVNGRAVTRRELSKAFDLVKDSDHWKNPINCVIKDPGQETLNLIEQSVAFFAGCETQITKSGKFVAISAAGYFNTLGA